MYLLFEVFITSLFFFFLSSDKYQNIILMYKVKCNLFEVSLSGGTSTVRDVLFDGFGNNLRLIADFLSRL